jgi:predicted O-methyltransferase YrrM
MSLTRPELITGLKNIPVFIFHPTIPIKFLMGGRVPSLKKAVEISLKQMTSRVNENEILSVNDLEFLSLIGRIGGYSQELLYRLIRLYKPETVIETGVYRGISSSFILQALEDNGSGILYSIDLPMAKYVDERGNLDYSPLSQGEITGFCVPDKLKKRWSLILGDSKTELPILLENVKSVDMFYHDSEHTYNSMMREYETVFPYLNKNSILSSDDVSWNNAFKDFCHSQGLEYFMVKNKFGYAIVKRDDTV